MAKKEKVGLYWGINSLAVSLFKGKKVAATSYADISYEQDSVDSFQENLKIQASFNKTLRELRIENKDIYLSAADRNFIFRYLELPLMGRKDIESSLFFEIEKYIPFKTKELLWDYEYIQSRKEKKIKVSFLGIREANYNQISSIFPQLGLSLRALEPASISLARLIKSKKDFSKDKHFAILDISNYEAYLTFFQDGLPVFNRYFDVSKTEGAIDKSKFVETVNYSFQYFRGEYKKANIEKVMLIGDSVGEQITASLEETVGVEIKNVLSSGLIFSDKKMTVEEIKASGAAQRENLTYRFRPVFSKREEEAEAAPVKVLNLSTGWRYGVLAGIVAAGILASAFLWFMLSYKEWEKKADLSSQEKNIPVPKELEGRSWQAIKKKTEEKSGQISYLTERESFYPEIWPFLSFLEKEKNIPNYLWLDKLNIDLVRNSYRGNLAGYVYFQDSIKENVAIDEFIDNLKNDKAINDIFPQIQLNVVKRLQLKKYQVTHFSIDFKSKEN